MLLTNIFLQVTIISFLILLTIVTGMVLHKKEKPYNKIMFSVHKFSTLGFLAYLSFILVNIAKNTGFDSLFGISLIVGLIAMVGLLFSGGMLSLDKAFKVNLGIHRITLFLFLIAYIGILYKILH